MKKTKLGHDFRSFVTNPYSAYSSSSFVPFFDIRGKTGRQVGALNGDYTHALARSRMMQFGSSCSHFHVEC